MEDFKNNLDHQEFLVESDRLNEVINVISRKIYEQENLSELLRDDNVKLNQLMWDDTAKAIYDFDDVAAMPIYLSDMQQMAYRRERNARQLDFLNRIIDSPWFARISFLEDGETSTDDYYIGIGNLNDDDGNVLIVDWRADISSLYYDSDIGPAQYETRGYKIVGQLTRKRQYKIANGQIVFMFDSDVAIEDQLLIELLQQNTSSHMKNIVSTIQREQNSVIKSAPGGVLVVSGPAGSGKTSVAMHRIAYLMYKSRKSFNSNSILILSPNNIFNDYISDVLPSLGEDTVPTDVFSGIIPHNIPIPDGFKIEGSMSFMNTAASNISDERRHSIMVKSSREFTDTLERFLSLESIGYKRFKDLSVDGNIVFSARDMEEFYYSSYPGLNIQMRLNRIRNAGNAAILSWAEKETQRLFAMETESSTILGDGSEIMSRCRNMVRGHVNELMAQLNNITSLNVYAIYRTFLKRLANGRISSNLPTELLNDAWESYSEASSFNLIQYEDLCAYALACLILGIVDCDKNKLHVVIDEAQDYSYLQFRLLKWLYPSASFTCLGDPNQRVNAYTGEDNLSQIPHAFKDVSVTSVRLTKSFRSTSEISEYCSGILGGVSGENIVRHGDPVEFNKSATLQDFSKYINLIQGKIAPGSSTAILCKNIEQCNKCYDILLRNGIPCRKLLNDASAVAGIVPGEITIMPVFMAKGLEFDNVIIHNSKDYPQDMAGRQLFYTACTRALHRLYINTIN